MNTPDQHELEVLAEQLGMLLLEKQLKLATAESCTGGWVAQCLTAIAGSSAWFDRGFVTYSNQAKQEMLGVAEETLVEHGAVSQPVAVSMAQGALRNSHADWAVAITGVAGPAGGSTEKPVGTVCFAWVNHGEGIVTETRHFQGGRHEVRAQSVAYALTELIDQIHAASSQMLA